MSEVASAAVITPELIEKDLREGKTDILKRVSRWRVYALFGGRKGLFNELPKRSQEALDFILDSCKESN